MHLKKKTGKEALPVHDMTDQSDRESHTDCHPVLLTNNH
nr:hypothetical protein [Mucilaginibacter sp. X4EP1]